MRARSGLVTTPPVRSVRTATLRSVAVLCLAASLVVAGCAAVDHRIQSLRAGGLFGRRPEPGSTLIDSPESVWEEYECADRGLPFLAIEKTDLIPSRVTPGGEINQRLTYALCPAKQGAAVKGDLHRRLYFGDGLVDHQVWSGFELYPGRWAYNAFVTVPADAEAGSYTLELEFKNKKTPFKEVTRFSVAK